MANDNKQLYEQSLDNFIAQNPTIGNINTADFRDFLVGLVGHESSYNSKAKQGSYYGWYQTKAPVGSSEWDQHRLAFEHLNHLFNNVITKADINRAKELGIEQAPLLLKYWNQENRVNNYLWNNKDNTDGLGTKISEYGNDLTMPLDTIKYALDNLYGDYVVKDGDNWFNIQKRVRMPGRNYTTMGRDLWDLSNRGVPFGSLKIGQSFNFGEEPQRRGIRQLPPHLMKVYPKQRFEPLHNFIEEVNPYPLSYQKGNKLVYRSREASEPEKNTDLVFTPYGLNDTATKAETKTNRGLDDELTKLLYVAPSYPIEEVSVYNPNEKKEEVEEAAPVEAPEETTQEMNQETAVTTPTVTSSVITTPGQKGTIKVHTSHPNTGDMKEFLDLVSNEGISLILTSGTRPGAVTASGHRSKHSVGEAIDVAPIDGDFNKLKEQLFSSAKIIQYMKEHNVRILDETSQYVQSRTKATGPHFHISINGERFGRNVWDYVWAFDDDWYTYTNKPKS